ncbi:BrnA antitoxin of type II toxin-antitoxin system [Agrobacterium vitis]|nr:BrnA antitoxin of type II toxin-antitoxin system [Agrobacterium vitis]
MCVGLYKRGLQGKMSKEHIVRYTAEEINQKIARGESLTDWARVNAKTDEEIERDMRDDPDWCDFIDVDWSKAELVIPHRKKAISIRLDDDIIEYFQSTGKGYQTRINAVLRHFVREQTAGKDKS